MKQGDIIHARFRVEALAGKGGMGYVYRCVDLTSNSPVAVKVLTRVSEDSLRRFSQEAEILANLDHPGVVRYLSHGHHEDTPYLAMEWLSGESLAQRLSRSPLRVAEALDVARHCALALAPIHQIGVVHRDIKPSNIFLIDKSTDQIKLLDFGIARLNSSDRDHTKTGLLLGSPGYLAPEQARGDKRLNASADVFALGSVLFECLAGRPPFTASHSIAVLVKVLFEEVPRLREFRPMLPAPMEALVAKMLSKDPRERHPDGAAVAEALAQIEAFDEQATSMAASLYPSALTQQEQRLLGVVLLLGVLQPSSLQTASVTGDIPTISISKEEVATHASDDDNVMNDASRLVMLRELVARFEGRVEPLADGSMVVSVASSGEAVDLAAHAARCALSLRKALPKAPMSLALGVGARAPFGAVVDRAATLLSSAPALSDNRPTVYIDDTTAALLEQRFSLKRMPGCTLLEAELTTESGARTLLGRPSPFIGREAELRLIRARFDDCVGRSSPKIVLFTAPAGAGKSRLRTECAKEITALCLVAKGDPMTIGVPFAMLSSALRGAALVQETDTAEARFRKVAAFVTRRLDTVNKQDTYSQPRRLAEFLGELAQTPAPTPSAPLRTARQEPSLMGDQLRRAFLEWLEIEASQQPVTLILEDLHWADSSTIQLIGSALSRSSHLPIFVLAFARPEVHARLGPLSELMVEELQLSPLSKSDCQALLQHTLGERATQRQQDELFEISQGNAFYAEELIRAMSAGYEALPASVLAMAQARIDNLPEAARHILRAASVFGESFSLAALLPMLRGLVDERQLRDQARWLTRQEVLTPSQEREQLQFRHALMREAAYAKLTPQDRALAHRMAAQWLEERSLAAPYVIAEHWRQGEEPKLAATWYVRAAKAALEANDLRAVIELAETAERLGVEESSMASLYQAKAEAYGWLGEPQKAQALWGNYLQFAPRGSATWYNANAALFMSSLQLRDFERSLEIIDRLQESTPQNDSAAESSLALAVVVSFACVGGLYQVATSFVEKFNQSEPPPPGAESWVSLGWRNQAHAYGALYIDGDPWEYLQRAQAAMRYFEKAGHLRGAMTQAAEVGRAYMCLGAFSQAERFLREKLAQIEQLQLQYVKPFARLFLAQSLRSQQKYKEAIPLIEIALQEFEQTNHGPKQGDSRAELGKILLENNELAEADSQLQRATPFLAFALPAKSKATAIHALILLAQGKPTAALELSREALDLLDGLGGKGYEDIYLYWAHIEALMANKNTKEAKDFIYEAKRRISQRADRITDFNFRESFLRDVEENRKILSLAHQFQI